MTEYKGLIHFESFTGTTDGSGDLVSVLEAVPTGSPAIIMFSNTSGCLPRFQGLTGSSLTTRYYKLQYDKPTDTGSTLSELPSGISSCGSIAQTDAAGGTAGLGNYSAGGATTAGAGGAHTMTLGSMYIHSHGGSLFTITDTGSAVLTSTAVSLNVVYL